jgi:hypothetical protein
MDSNTEVAVYHFRPLDGGWESSSITGFKATRAAIVERFKGDVLEGTEEFVPADALDADGCYRRVPTGWGGLS